LFFGYFDFIGHILSFFYFASLIVFKRKICNYWNGRVFYFYL